MTITAAISIGNDSSGSKEGTLGCFVTLNANSSTNALLSNHHVIFESGARPPIKIGYPDAGTCRCCCPKNIIAIATSAGKMGNFGGTYIDCAIAVISPSIIPSNRIRGLTGVSRSSGTPIGDFIAGTAVAQLNERVVVCTFRRLIPGVIIAPEVNIVYMGQPEQPKQLQIRVDPGYEEDRVFGSGDSGSVVVNRFNEVVGLMHSRGADASDPNPAALMPYIIACPIGAVMHELGINIPSAVPSSPTSGVSLATLYYFPASEPAMPTDPVALKYELLIKKTSLGALLWKQASTFKVQVGRLINNCRPVKVSWHRLYGPSFLAHFLKSAKEEAYSVPLEIKGISQYALLSGMAAVLKEHGDDALKHEIERFQDILLKRIAGSESIEEAVTRLAACDKTEPDS